MKREDRDKDNMHRHLVYLQRPATWNPQLRPYCPVTLRVIDLKHRPLGKALGYVIEGEGPIVHMGNVFAPKPRTDEKVVFSSWEKLYNAGWRVD